MKVVVFGGSGLIGKKVVELLKATGHEAIVASPSKGINAVTKEGLVAALQGAEVIVDTMNSPSFEDQAAKEFFEKSTQNIIAATQKDSIKHYVALSVVGTHKLQISGYFQGKLNQERLIETSGIPFTIVRATQFFEFASYIGDLATNGKIVTLPPAEMQPIAGSDVAEAIAKIAIDKPYNDKVDIAGPEKILMTDFIRKTLEAKQDSRKVVADPKALYVQTFPVDHETLTPSGNNLILGDLGFDTWLAQEFAI